MRGEVGSFFKSWVMRGFGPGSWQDLGGALVKSWAAPGHLGRLLGGSWAVLGGSWALLGGSWALLGGSWTLLGSSWAALGRSWAPLGAPGARHQFGQPFLIDFHSDVDPQSP